MSTAQLIKSPSFDLQKNDPCYECLTSCKTKKLEELLDDCFKYTLGQISSPQKKERILDFVSYLEEVHSLENLLFIMEIYRYELYYEKFHENANASNKHWENYLNPHVSESLDLIPDRVPTNTSAASLTSTRSQMEKTYSDLDGLVFLSENSESELLTPQSPVTERDIWESFRDVSIYKSLEDDELDDSSSESSKKLIGISSEEKEFLGKQWKLIIQSYVAANSEFEVNLNDITRSKLIEEDTNGQDVHSPKKLSEARSEIFGLLEENAFCTFSAQYKQKQLRCDGVLSPKSGPSQGCSHSLSKQKMSKLGAASVSNSPTLSPLNSSSYSSRPSSLKRRFFPNAPNSASSNSEPHSSNSSASNLTHLFENFKLHLSSRTDSAKESETSSLESGTNGNISKEERSFRLGKLWKSKKMF